MPIRYYVSWYQGDPVYPKYSLDCSLLLSPTSLSGRWTLHDLNALPARLIIDSGGYRYHRSGEKPPTAAELFKRQLAILSGHTIPSMICPLDSPLDHGTHSAAYADAHIARTLAHAFELQRLVRQSGLPPNVEPLAIVQGNDRATLRYCAQELLDMGYRNFGLGSLARIPDLTEIANRACDVVETVQRPLHLFGIGSPRTLQTLDADWIASVDSSLPAKAAACNELFYSEPFRRYGIMSSDGVSRSKLPVQRCLAEPLLCACPICRMDPGAVVRIGRRDHIRARAVHNYHHLRRTIEDLSRE